MGINNFNNLILVRKMNEAFYVQLLAELGMLRVKDQCALCFKKIKIKDYHIQLYTDCRSKILDKKYFEVKK